VFKLLLILFMSEIQKLIDLVEEFRTERDWKQFHNAKNSAAALVTEAAEYLELFRWTAEEDLDERVEDKREEISDELADVLFWVLTISKDLDIDLKEALREKLKKTAEKYPAEKVRGSTKKHTEYKD